MRFLVLAILLAFLPAASFGNDRSVSFDEKPVCEKQGGVWRQFGNSCLDSCISKFDKFSICAQAITYGCDCLRDKCFDGNQCVLMSDYKVKYDEIFAQEKEILEQKKVERKDEFKQNQQIIMQKLMPSQPNQQNQQGQQSQQNQQGQNQRGSNQANYGRSQNVNIVPMPNQPQPSPLPTIRQDPNFSQPPAFAQSQELLIQALEQKSSENNSGQEVQDLLLPQVPIN
jgi:hypothetical protein